MEAIEAWFIERLGTDWYALNESGRGTPFVHLSVDFRSALTPHDVLVTTVALARAGGSSLEFRLAGRTEDGRLAFEGRFVCVFVAAKGDAGHKPIPIPDEFRAAVEREAALGGVGS